jgi:hypothetical protein
LASDAAISPTRAFILLVAVLVWVPALWFWIDATPDTYEFADVLQSENTLRTFDHRNGNGCAALAAQPGVDILVVGNSHTYAGIDHYTLARQFPDHRTGVCSHGVWHTDSFLPLFDFLDDHEVLPQTIIWVVDAYFLMDQIDSDYSRMMREMIENPAFVQEKQVEWEQNLDQTGFLTGEDFKELQAGRDLSETELFSRPSDFYEGLVRRHTFLHEQRNSRFFSLGEDQSLDTKLRAVCRLVAARDIEFHLVASPLPPAELAEYLTPEIEARMFNVADILAQRMPCVRSALSDDLAGWGLDMRHFFNRFANPEFPYGVFDDMDRFEHDYAALTRSQQLFFYDATHLNPFGAEIFTRELASRLRSAPIDPGAEAAD